MLKLVLGQPLLAPSDTVPFAVGIENVDHDCLCLTTAPADPEAEVIVWDEERSALEEVVIRTQSCKDAIQERPSNALVLKFSMEHELEFDAAAKHCVSTSEVGSDGEADDVFLLLSNDVSLVATSFLPHVDGNDERILLVLGLLQTTAPVNEFESALLVRGNVEQKEVSGRSQKPFAPGTGLATSRAMGQSSLSTYTYQYNSSTGSTCSTKFVSRT